MTDEPLFKLTVTYGSGNTQEHAHLSDIQAEMGLGAFSRDLFSLLGEGVRKVSVEIETPNPRPDRPDLQTIFSDQGAIDEPHEDV